MSTASGPSIRILARANARARPRASLVSRGAAINVPLVVVCTSVRADVEVAVNPRAGSQMPQGFGDKEITCTGDIPFLNALPFASAGADNRLRSDAGANLAPSVGANQW
jgi:hypothetical protein